MKGVVVGVRDEGTIVLMQCRGERYFVIPFDHRPFQQMWEAEGNLVGREIEYEDATVRFIE